MSNLNGKYAIVTGGGKGIGAAIVKRYIQEGAAGVAIFDYDEALAQKLDDKRAADAAKVLEKDAKVAAELNG